MPLAFVLLLVASSLWAGTGPVPSASASEVDVAGTVDPFIFLDTTNCPPVAVAIGEMVPGIDPWKTAVDESGQRCWIAFGTTNHAAGTDLAMFEDPAAPTSPPHAMKCVTTCLGSALDDYEGSAEPAAGSSAFGAQLLSAAGAADALWSQAPAVHDVQDTGDTACRTTGTGTGTCAFTWGATASTGDGPGDYQAQADLIVLAR